MTVSGNNDARTWVREGTGVIPRGSRGLRRSMARNAARLRQGSVDSAMEAAVSPYAETPSALTDHPKARRTDPAHVVHVSTYPVFPRTHGGSLRAHAMASALATDGFRSTIVSLTHDPDLAGTRDLGERLVEHTVAIPARVEATESRLRLLSGPTSITDISVGLCWPGIGEFVAQLKAQLETATAAVAVQAYLGRAVNVMAPHVPLVLDAHNDEFALKSELLGDSPGGRWLLERVRELEDDASSHARLVVAATKADLASLDRRYVVAAISDVVPNGVDAAAIPFVTGVSRLERRKGLCNLLGLPTDNAIAMFVGSAHEPNLEAARVIVELARVRSDITFILVGSHTKMLGRRIPPNVHPLGMIPEDELDLLLAGADLALNPMETGSGSNLKLLSYLASGLRVIATPTGARGIDAERAGIIVAEAADFAQALDEALSFPADARAEKGRRYVEANADWAVIGARFRNMVRLAVGR